MCVLFSNCDHFAVLQKKPKTKKQTNKKDKEFYLVTWPKCTE